MKRSPSILACAVMLGCTASQHFGVDGGSRDGGDAETIRPPVAEAGQPNLLDGQATEVDASGSWEWLSPIPHGHTLRAVWSTAPNDIWFVGDHGSIARSDGVTAKLVYLGDVGQRFTAVWGSGPNDVWVGGDGGRSNLMHWDGTRWQDNFLVSEEVITALWGWAPNDVYAVGFDRIRQWNGSRWSTIPQGDPGTREWSSGTRALWGAKNHETWLASPSGLHHQGSPFQYFMPATLPDPWSHGAYEAYGVWGTDSNDVWVTASLKEGPRSNEVALLHYDGTSFSEVSTRRMRIFRGDPDNGFGRTLWGLGGHPVYLDRYALELLYWDGTTWQDLAPPTWKEHPNRGGSILNFGYSPGLAVGGGDRLFVVGGYGYTREVAPDGGFRDFLNSGSNHLLDLRGARAEDGTVFALGDDRVLREWDVATSRWLAVQGLAVQAPEEIGSFSAVSRRDVWVGVGERYKPNRLLHWNGTVWGPRVDAPCYIQSVRALSDGTVWVGGLHTHEATGCIARWDGSTWFEPPYTGETFLTMNAIDASGPDNVWFAAGTHLLQWDGWALSLRLTRTDNGTFSSLYVRSKDDVWTAGVESLHWDGAAWKTIGTDRTLRGIYGRSANDMWFVYDYGLEGRIGHWDGNTLTTIRGTSGRLFSIFGSADEVWATGEGGATLRMKMPVATP